LDGLLPTHHHRRALDREHQHKNDSRQDCGEDPTVQFRAELRRRVQVQHLCGARSTGPAAAQQEDADHPTPRIAPVDTLQEEAAAAEDPSSKCRPTLHGLVIVRIRMEEVEAVMGAELLSVQAEVGWAYQAGHACVLSCAFWLGWHSSGFKRVIIGVMLRHWIDGYLFWLLLMAGRMEHVRSHGVYLHFTKDYPSQIPL
jgi:hypothetical protein